jgi:hypothetical protein
MSLNNPLKVGWHIKEKAGVSTRRICATDFHCVSLCQKKYYVIKSNQPIISL